MLVKCPRCRRELRPYDVTWWSGDELVYECSCGRVVSMKEYEEISRAISAREVWLDSQPSTLKAVIDDEEDSTT